MFLLLVLLTYWSTKCVTCFAQHDDNFHQFWSLYNHLSLSYRKFAVNALCDLVTLPFNPRQWSHMAGYVIISSNFVSPKPAYPFLSYDMLHAHQHACTQSTHTLRYSGCFFQGESGLAGCPPQLSCLFHWIPLTVHLQRLCMRLIVGDKFSHISEILDPNLSIQFATFMALWQKEIEISVRMVYVSVLNAIDLSVYTWNHACCECDSKSATLISCWGLQVLAIWQPK